MDRTPPRQPATVVDLDARRRCRASQPAELRQARAVADVRELALDHLAVASSWARDALTGAEPLDRAICEVAHAARLAERILMAGEIA